MMDWEIRLFTWWNGQKVGQDDLGNTYYIEKKARVGMPQRRWVVYKGPPEASKVPPLWSAWLHYSMQDVPRERQEKRQACAWEKPHQPNLSSAQEALISHARAKARTERAYEPWSPSKTSSTH